MSRAFVAHPYWYAWAMVVGALVCAFVGTPGWSASERSIRITGMFLQLIGVLMVAVGIWKTREEFGLSSPLTRIRQAIGRLWRRRGRVVGGSGNIHASANVSADGLNSLNRPQDGSIEQRLKVAEINLKWLQEFVLRLDKRLSAEIRKNSTYIEQESHAREAEDVIIRKKLEAAQTGGLYIPGVGAIWLFIGVVLGTASPELNSVREWVLSTVLLH